MVTIQFTKFVNVSYNSEDDDISYGYRIYNEEKSEYNNSFISLEDLNKDINKDTILDFLQEHHPDFYKIIYIDNEFDFNGHIITDKYYS